jgi:putative flavoprotein involved in K+ transport
MYALDPSPSLPSTRVERYGTIVIGGGQAGLAAGYHLAQRDVDFVILDAASRTGDSWRHRWDGLRLFTPAAYSGLPGMVFPAPPAHLPDKDEVAAYMERYAERFDLPVRHDVRVSSLRRDGTRYVVEAPGIRYEADSVVVATGPFHAPRTPPLASRLLPRIHQFHSSAYVNPLHLPPGSALVVGAGNSGVQIALELARTRDVTLAGDVPGYLPRTFLGRDIYDWIWPIIDRFTRRTMVGRLLRRRTAHADPLIGTTPDQLRRAGIRRVGKVTDVRDGLPVANGVAQDAAIVVWATGFAPAYQWIHLPIPTDHGHPLTQRGVVSDHPGLYFIGLRWQHRLTSALIGGVGADAEFIANQVVARSIR